MRSEIGHSRTIKRFHKALVISPQKKVNNNNDTHYGGKAFLTAVRGVIK
jgi:hypothetical protein